MPILSPIGRRSTRVRALVAIIYALLIAGSLTMLYPFGLMLAGSTKSGVDVHNNRIVPEFLYDDLALYRKHLEGLFNENLAMLQATYDMNPSSFRDVDPPSRVRAKLVEAWLQFVSETDLPPNSFQVGYLQTPVSRSALPHHLRAFKRELSAKVDADLRRLNREMGTEFVSWNAFYVIPPSYFVRRIDVGHTPFGRALQEFKTRAPTGDRFYFALEGFYKTLFLQNQYTDDIQAYNRAHGTRYRSWDEVRLDTRVADGRTGAERSDWETFVRTILNLRWISADPGAASPYRQFLRAKYGTLDVFNERYSSSFASFDEVPLPDGATVTGVALSDWDSFLQGWQDPETGKLHALPLGSVRLRSVGDMFRAWLQRNYDSIEALNQAMGTDFAEWAGITPPQREAHYLDFLQRRGALRWEFLVRNYLSVLDFMLLRGRGVVNTAVYCLLAILSALIVNPLAAYALSRYRPPSAYKVLLFLMLTMSFPPMVTQIPVFLMLREFNLLNTFWALVLPGLANGYSIFLLKGFFDSLPRELYESASLDGAGEFRIFWQITMSLSTPILAVIALNAFTHAYSNFMMALLICQDEKMWTLMPWLYQLQQRSAPGVVFASLIVAAIPTFIVFAFCQNVILRGIVVPVEK